MITASHGMITDLFLFAEPVIKLPHLKTLQMIVTEIPWCGNDGYELRHFRLRPGIGALNAIALNVSENSCINASLQASLSKE